MAARVRPPGGPWGAIRRRAEARGGPGKLRRLAAAVSAPAISAIALSLVWVSFRPAHPGTLTPRPVSGAAGTPALRIASRIPLPGEPTALAASGADAWVALWSPASCAGELARIDASTDAVVAAVPLDVVPTDVVLGAGSAWVGGFRCGRAQAIAATLPGASWQRCRTHFMRNLFEGVPKAVQPFVPALVRSIFAQPDREQVEAQLRRVTDQLLERFPQAGALLEEAGPDITAFAAFPTEHWRQIWSNDPQERLNREVRRRTEVVGIFPDRASAVRLVGMVLVEQHEEWQVARRYMSPESLARARVRVIDGEREEVMPELVAAG
jgi:hypothetical protein